MADDIKPWLKTPRKESCNHCWNYVEAVEIVQLDKDFDSARVCTKCVGELNKKIEDHRATWPEKGRKEEIRIFKKYMEKRSIFHDDTGTLGCLCFFILLILIIGLAIKLNS